MTDTLPELQSLRAVDRLEVISLVDNMVEVLATVDRPEVQSALQWVEADGDELSLPLAEHGFALLLRTVVGNEHHTVLFDAGLTDRGILNNTAILRVDLAEIEAIIVSHGHFDHTGALLTLLEELAREDLPVLVHKDMFQDRAMLEDGEPRPLRRIPSREALLERGARLVESREPQLLAGGSLLLMGEVPRVTSFEQGFTPGRILVDGEWQPDPWMWDDRGLVVNVKDRGLVVISGCAHSGIVNNLRHAQHLTGKEFPIYAVMGGFHLAGEAFEPLIEPTVAALREIGPEMVVASHCTGWRGIQALAREMPTAFVHPSVGHRYVFGE